MKCPGQDSQYWKPGAIFEVPCPECGHAVEFFKDETTRKCSHCGHRFLNPGLDFGCAAYCPHAEQCIGNLPPELIAQKQDLLKDRVAIEMKRALGRDFRRIGRSMRAARYAEEIGREEQGNLAVILTATYLYEIGAPAAERKHGSADDRSLAEEGPPLAREILERLGAAEPLVEEVCAIVAHHRDPGGDESVNARCVLDAHGIAALEEREKRGDAAPSGPDSVKEGRFLTRAAIAVASRVLAPYRGEETH
jgi:HD superfamily phosphodiesterase